MALLVVAVGGVGPHPAQHQIAKSSMFSGSTFRSARIWAISDDCISLPRLAQRIEMSLCLQSAGVGRATKSRALRD